MSLRCFSNVVASYNRCEYFLVLVQKLAYLVADIFQSFCGFGPVQRNVTMNPVL